MKNFSGWVRERIKDELKAEQIKKANRPEYWAYCAKCDVSAYGPNQIQLEYKYCPKCHDHMEYKGVV